MCYFINTALPFSTMLIGCQKAKERTIVFLVNNVPSIICFPLLTATQLMEARMMLG